jgi:hypothetical protein
MLLFSGTNGQDYTYESTHETTSVSVTPGALQSIDYSKAPGVTLTTNIPNSLVGRPKK